MRLDKTIQKVNIQEKGKTYEIDIENDLLEKWKRRFGDEKLKEYLITLAKTEITELK